jgi:hypothetical protein
MEAPVKRSFQVFSILFVEHYDDQWKLYQANQYLKIDNKKQENILNDLWTTIAYILIFLIWVIDVSFSFHMNTIIVKIIYIFVYVNLNINKRIL